eukprot:SAG31_NODE_15625_length_746_cov_0.935085_1_plen_128_part_10
MSHTFSNYRFSQFSDWISIFKGGTGTITIREHDSGKILLHTQIPLTPGPLVVVIKDSWPPKEANNVETVAASFIPTKNGSAVRLFNLAMDVPAAGLTDSSGHHLASGVQYSLGSSWSNVPGATEIYTA